MKTCSKCGLPHGVVEFSKCSENSDGLQFKCRACQAVYSREHRKENREKSRRYRERNPGAWKNRYHSDPAFRIATLLRSRIRKALKWSVAAKSNTTKSLLGCPIIWLEAWFESLFKPGMSWENQGLVWHIDHIKPCAEFDLTDPEQQRICFHWTNLQPLFALDNLRKSDSYNG